MKKIITLGLLGGFLVSLSACAPIQAPSTNESADATMEDENNSVEEVAANADTTRVDDVQKDDDAIIDDGGIVGGEPISYSGAVLAKAPAPLLDFNQADYDKATAAGKTIFLYFYANWCPTCKAEQPSLITAFDEFENDNVVGFRVNYKDNQTDADETALARQFGVAYQHTKVVVKDGEMVSKSPESWSLERYREELNKL